MFISRISPKRFLKSNVFEFFCLRLQRGYMYRYKPQTMMGRGLIVAQRYFIKSMMYPISGDDRGVFKNE